MCHNDPQVKMVVGYSMNDFRIIQSGDKKFTTTDAMIIHEQGPGWREKAGSFGSPYSNPRDKEVAAQWALKQFAADKPVDVGPLADTFSAMRDLNLQKQGDTRSTGIGETQPISANENIRTDAAPEHIAADWQDHLPDIEQRGPATPVNSKELYERLQARGFDMAQSSPQNPKTTIAPEIQSYLGKMAERAGETGKTVGGHVAGQVPGSVAQTPTGEAAELAKRTEAVRAQLPEHMAQSFDAALAASDKAPVEGSLTHDEVTKAALAAAKCAGMKGVDLVA